LTDTALILAGGMGTRLREVVKDVPKPMALINGKPFLAYLLHYLSTFGIKNVVLCVSHRHEAISSFFGDNHDGMKISYVVEDPPRGTGGGLRLGLLSCAAPTVLAMNGDSLFDIDLRDFSGKHEAADGKFSLALRKVTDTGRYGSILTDEQDTVTSFTEKTGSGSAGRINGGVYLADRDWFISQTPDTSFSLEKDFFEKKAGDPAIKGFEYEGYFIDIGIPEDYFRAQDEFKRFGY
jgi:D-glycero-alpha-D-manno-heptose 1-phosphate guanylyltransferase